MNLGKTIISIRKKKGLTQKELAKQAGISINAMCSIENDLTHPKPEIIKRICKSLDVPTPILYFMSIDEKDVPKDKRGIYNALAPSLRGLIDELIK